MELALKAAICDRNSVSFPQTRAEFRSLNMQSMMTHDLEDLLQDSGKAASVRPKLLAEWSIALNWDPEKRYAPIGQITRRMAADMIVSTKTLLGVLL